MYKYYIEVKSNEHFLNCKEIAMLYGIYTKSGNPHNRLIKVLFDLYPYKEQYFYHCAKGRMMEVYPYNYYHEVITDFLKEQQISIGLNTVILKNNYKFLIDKH